jgi:hypothetical protein
MKVSSGAFSVVHPVTGLTERILFQWQETKLVLKEEISSQVFELSLVSPLRCVPCEIPKPWGKEIWFTGVEKRGVSGVESLNPRQSIPLHWLLVPELRDAFLGKHSSQLVLLKILAPLPVPVFGDLYTEIHSEKNEVYICTRVTSQGQGGLRFGINPDKWRKLGCNEALFRQEFLAAVRQYETVRKNIDSEFDRKKQSLGLAANEPIDVQTLALWHQQLPESVQRQEEFLRQEMNSFTSLFPFSVGDVAKVPTGVPHALQAGVEVVEFQTATYERNIVSFAQKVLTQNHWDTEKALDILDFHKSLQTPYVSILSDSLRTQIVQFVGFEVFHIAQADKLSFSSTHYSLVHIVHGRWHWTTQVSNQTPSTADSTSNGVPLPLLPGAYLFPGFIEGALVGSGMALLAVPRQT